jgi:cytidine deaminase
VNSKYHDLVAAACKVRENSYSPYSGFRVGAALLGAGGTVYLGTNVENASFGLSNCAERTAIFRAVTDGETSFEAIAICADGQNPTPPCGACRQVLMEFGPDLIVLTAGEDGPDGSVIESTISDLLPEAFRDYRKTEDSAS